MLVSIIVPAYNTEKYISRCLDSICNQSYRNIEIIVINDASEDNTASIIQTYSQQDNRLVFVDLAQNVGNGQGRNIGIKMAKGEYVLFVDSDDYIEPNLVEEVMNEVRRQTNPQVVILGHQKILEKRSGLLGNKKMKPELPRLTGNETKEQLFTCYVMGYKNFGAQPWLYFCRKDYLLQHNIFFDEARYYFEDVIFTTKLIFNVDTISQVSKPLYNYVIREGSIMTGNKSKKRIESWVRVCMLMKNFLKSNGAFERYKDLYTVHFVNCAFLLSFFDYVEMENLDEETEKFLYDLSQSDVVKNFYYTNFNLPYIEDLTKDEKSYLKRMKRVTLLISNYFGFAKIIFRTSYKVGKRLKVR